MGRFRGGLGHCVVVTRWVFGSGQEVFEVLDLKGVDWDGDACARQVRVITRLIEGISMLGEMRSACLNQSHLEGDVHCCCNVAELYDNWCARHVHLRTF